MDLLKVSDELTKKYNRAQEIIKEAGKKLAELGFSVPGVAIATKPVVAGKKRGRKPKAEGAGAGAPAAAAAPAAAPAAAATPLDRVNPEEVLQPPEEEKEKIVTAGIRDNLFINMKEWVTAKALAEKMGVNIKALRIVLGAPDIRKKTERRGERGAYEYRFAGV